ncbi:MAG: shikimate kinase [Lachnospiraceae bacterium]|nr:shikimate kinase [Lachnospiraceae bacterium]
MTSVNNQPENTSSETPNLFLIGFMGSGKSTISSKLSEKLGRKVIEMDAEIEKREGRTINEIFATDGESYFRDVESALVREIDETGGMIVSCGGGVVLRQENVEAMKRHGRIIYLSATPETIYQRVRYSTNRPILNGHMNVEYIAELMKKRLDLYLGAADVIVETDGKKIPEIVGEIERLVNES